MVSELVERLRNAEQVLALSGWNGDPVWHNMAHGASSACAEAATLLSAQEAEITRYANALKACRPIIERLITAEHNVETWGLKQRLAAIDAALTLLPEGGQ